MIREAIKQALDSKGLGLQEVSEFLGIGKPSVCLYLKGKRSISANNVDKLMQWLNLEVKTKGAIPVSHRDMMFSQYILLISKTIEKAEREVEEKKASMCLKVPFPFHTSYVDVIERITQITEIKGHKIVHDVSPDGHLTSGAYIEYHQLIKPVFWQNSISSD